MALPQKCSNKFSFNAPWVEDHKDPKHVTFECGVKPNPDDDGNVVVQAYEITSAQLENESVFLTLHLDLEDNLIYDDSSQEEEIIDVICVVVNELLADDETKYCSNLL